ncbi:MAG: S1 RNA-binding domain-containing protein, partial [Polyangiaceae bacterium]
TFVELEPGIDGYVSTREYTKDIEDGTRKLKRGDEVRVEVESLDVGDRRIDATFKLASERVAEERSAPVARPGEPKDNRRGGTLGDLIKEKMGDQLGDLPSKG